MRQIDRAVAKLIDFKLDKAVGGSGVAAVDVVIVELQDSDGTKGLGFSYALGGGGSLPLAAANSQLERFVVGKAVASPRAAWRNIVRSFNRTGLGPNLIGLAAIDMAMWDLHARRQQLPLGIAMGGEQRTVAIYGSGGFNTAQSPDQAAEVAVQLASRGCRAIKPRVAGVPKDDAVLAAVRAAVGADVAVMVDANEKCDISSARRLLRVAEGYGVLFVEEPLPWSVASTYSLLPSGNVSVAAGEHAQDYVQLVSMMQGGLLDVVQPDLAMIGGLTPILDLSIVAEGLGVTVSPHFLHGLFVHVAAVSSSIRWLEEFPLLEPLFDGWPPTNNGTVAIPIRAGHGLSLSDKAHRLLA